MRMPEKVYIGDSVYVEYDGYHFVLTTDNGYPDDPRNRIALEPPVYNSLVQYVKYVERWFEQERERAEKEKKE